MQQPDVPLQAAAVPEALVANGAQKRRRRERAAKRTGAQMLQQRIHAVEASLAE